MNEVVQYAVNHADRFESDLFDWLRIPSIGTDPAFQQDTRRAAAWIADQFERLKLNTELIETEGHPLVFAESPPVENKPTVLVYGHYDVQPPDPLEQWVTPPFEPAVRDGNVFARGATDDKGQMITHLFAVESWLQARGELPVQVKFLIEGEEESGGTGISAFLKGKLRTSRPVGQMLAADIAVISDCSQFAPGQPAITHGLRGMIYCEVSLSGPAQDLHSGAFGGAVSNPANAVNTMLAAMISEAGRIQVPGFYDDVLELTALERQRLADLEFSDEGYLQEVGAAALAGEAGYSTLERRWCRPTFDINGLWSGYQGPGAKTVLPAQAGAKFSFRLVPNQDPAKIKVAILDWLEQHSPPGIRMDVQFSGGVPGFVLPLDSPFMRAASQAIARGFGVPPVFIRSGGSIPIVNSLLAQQGIRTLLLGWGQDDDNLHSPNEKFSLKDFHSGIRTSCYLLEELAKL